MQCECVHASNIHLLKSSGENLEYWHQRHQWNQWCTLYNLPPDAHPIIPTCAYMLHLTLLLACRSKRYGSETDMAAEASRCMRSCGTNNGNNTNGTCMSGYKYIER